MADSGQVLDELTKIRLRLLQQVSRLGYDLNYINQIIYVSGNYCKFCQLGQAILKYCVF